MLGNIVIELHFLIMSYIWYGNSTVYPKKFAHGFVVLCFVVVMQSFIMSSHEVFIHIHQGCFAGTGAIIRLPQCQWSKPDGYGKISQCITTTKHSKAKTVCIFLGIYCSYFMTWLLIIWRQKGESRHFYFIKYGPSYPQYPVFFALEITKIKLCFSFYKIVSHRSMPC